jgi:DNA-directed RNA polymerase specialized sigma24 family protein
MPHLSCLENAWPLSCSQMNAPPVDVLDLDAALAELEALNAEHSRIVELRYFAGLSIDETAAALGTSPSSVKRGWLAAKTFIRRRLDGAASPA